MPAVIHSSVPPTTESQSAIGAAEMQQLRREFPGDEVRELVETFSEEGSLVLEGMMAAAERGDSQTMGRAAHALRGAGGNFGAWRLDALCREIETHARAENLAGAANLLPQVRQEYRRVELALEKECGVIRHE